MRNNIKKLDANYKLFLNHIIGIATFSLAVGCLGTENPGFYALISLVFILALLRSAPDELKEVKSRQEEKLIKKTSSIKEIWYNYPGYFLGISFLVIVMLAHWSEMWLKFWEMWVK